MAQDTIQRTIQVEAPIEHVWGLLTSAKDLPQWWAPMTSATVDLRIGGAIHFEWDGHAPTECEIVELEPHTRFAYRWQNNGDGTLEDGQSTLVEFTLVADGSATSVSVLESGFAAMNVDEEERVRRHAGNSRGWTSVLDRLAAFVAADRAPV